MTMNEYLENSFRVATVGLMVFGGLLVLLIFVYLAVKVGTFAYLQAVDLFEREHPHHPKEFDNGSDEEDQREEAQAVVRPRNGG